MSASQCLVVAAAACLGLVAQLPAHAGEAYAQGGFPGAGIGYAQPIGERFMWRADVLTLGRRSGQYTEDGIQYDGKLRLDRAALFGDWFVTNDSGFRLTAGVGAHDARLDLTAKGTGQLLTIGTRSVVLGAGDRFDVKLEYPRVMPYLGLGYGHHRTTPGWGFIFDVGVFFGRTKISGAVSGSAIAAAGVTQADVDAELIKIREGAGDQRVLPQVTFGASYRY